ncbi:MAG: type II CAAX endopeptidase family protein [Cyclobacteriaceae bacterium]
MPSTLAHLSKAQISLIRERLQHEGIKTPELAEDLLDHFCVAIEEEMGQGQAFESAFEHVFNILQEDELKTTEMKTQELLEDKKIFYPDLFQSFLLVLMVFAIGWLVHLGVKAIAIGIEDLPTRELWFKQNYLLIAETSFIFSLGIPMGYAIWEKRKTQRNVSIFSFRSVPLYVYAVMLLVGVLIGVWLEPLYMFFPLFQKAREAERSILENFSPLTVIIVSIGNMVLLELLSRGIILRGLLMTMPPLKAILCSSLFCAIIIYPQFPSIFFLSLILGWVYWKTRSLYPAIFMLAAIQALYYGITPFISAPKNFYLYFRWWNYVDHNLWIYIPMVAGTLLLTIGLLYYLHQKLSAESSL